MENKLRPIYQAIDTHQYSKALKLTLAAPQNAWPITIALRCHCLERGGPSRYREACIELRSLVSVFGEDGWEELEERIWLLSLDSNASPDANSAGGTGMISSDVSFPSSTSGGAGGGGGKKGKGKGKKSKSSSANVPAAPAPAAVVPSSQNYLDAIDVLDLSIHERFQFFQNNKQPPSTSASTSTSTIEPIEITDETTLGTLAISITALRLPRTLAKIYSCAIQTLQTHIAQSNTSSGLDESLYQLSTQAYLANLKLISTMVEYTPNSLDDKKEKLHNARNVLKTWEEAQFIAMGLVKVSGERLYQNWLILATMEHCRSCRELLNLLEGTYNSGTDTDTGKDEHDDNGNDHEDVAIAQEKEKLSKKMGMLPRLAEMMTMKQIQSFSKEKEGFPPSADDVRLFVECLEMQSKFQEALDFLDQIAVGSKSGSQDSDQRERRQIEDENDVKDHVGSVIQMTEKERLEMKVQLLKKMGQNEAVFDIYSGELLVLMPDQWSYWKGLLECAALLDNDSQACAARCKIVLDRFLSVEQDKADNGKGPKVPLRGPHLFKVELVAYMIKNGSSSSSILDLSDAIVEYGSLYAPLVFCCFQDLRVYIDLLLEKSSENRTVLVSSEVQKVLNWALRLREMSDPNKLGDGEETSAAKQERKSKLRSYIASIKFCFEVWYQLCSQCNDDSEASKSVDDVIAPFIPSPEEMVSCWKNTMDLGSNPKEGGQKECLPGDDLVLLTVQLLSHRNRFEQEEERKQMHTYASVLLEYALMHSPYNAYIKIAAVKNLFLIGSGLRAIEVFDDMNVKQIQLDSCSYFVLRNLLDSGLYKEAIDQAGKIIRLHSTSEKDLCSYMPRAFENGNIRRGREMMSWQRNQMSASLQLLEAKGLIMDLAPLLNYGDLDDPKSPPPLGIVCGLVGSGDDEERERVEKIIRDSANFLAAPSILNIATESTSFNKLWSDNRDFTVNEHEILEESNFVLLPQESVIRAHEHSVLAKLVLLSQSIKPPKKGKIVKVQDGEALDKRSNSLCQAISSAEFFLSGTKTHYSSVHSTLFRAALKLSKAFSIIVAGRDVSNAPIDPTDSLTKREERIAPLLREVVVLINESASLWNGHSSDEGTSVRRLLPDILITLFATLKTTANACATFGWGKRKRTTKPIAGCLAEVAGRLQVLVEDLTKTLGEQLGPVSDLKYTSESQPRFLESVGSEEMIKKVIGDICSYRKEARDRISPILKQIKNDLETYDVTD